MIKVILIALLGLCPTEDSNQCVWDAEEQGNKRGSSFVAFGDLVVYL